MIFRDVKMPITQMTLFSINLYHEIKFNPIIDKTYVT